MHKLAAVIFLTICSLNISLAQIPEDSPNQEKHTVSYAYIRVEGFLSSAIENDFLSAEKNLSSLYNFRYNSSIL